MIARRAPVRRAWYSRTRTLPTRSRTRMIDSTNVVIKAFDKPDEVREMPFGRFELITVGGQTIGRATYQPGWRWSEHVGPGLGLAHGPVGWVGTIFVAPELRRSGLGGALTRAVDDELEARGCRTVVLIATSMGRPVYEREGFGVLDEQVRFSIDGLPGGGTWEDPRIRPFESRDF